MSTSILQDLDSHIDGVSVYASRIKAGKFLAQDSPVEADLVTGVPESGNAAAHWLFSGIRDCRMVQPLSRTAMWDVRLSSQSRAAGNPAYR